MYDPRFEHDACGVGFVCTLTGEATHRIVRQGLELLVNLEHRGACGCDEKTGDGAGVLLQLPHAFFAERCRAQGLVLPEPGDYAVGMVFLPAVSAQQDFCRRMIADAVRAEGQRLLGWRRVPTRNEHIGAMARAVEPSVWQFFVGRGPDVPDQAAFERKLYVIRKVVEGIARRSGPVVRDAFHIASLSTRTVVYKGMLTPDQVAGYYPDLTDPLVASTMAMVHARFSTNTLPQWPLAQPFRYLCHNGEINTLRGNVNWMRAREAAFEDARFGADMEKLTPVLTEGASDSAILDNALELLYHTGRDLPHAMMMLVPEAWEHHEAMDDDRRAFYEYHACLMEPWDGPATIPFTDGRYLGAVLDRNGLRPSRYTVTKDGLVVLASEAGVLPIDEARVETKGRLQPGRMFLVDLEERRLVSDEEIKERAARRRPYRLWLAENLRTLERLPAVPASQTGHAAADDPPAWREKLFGYTLEDERLLIAPMALKGKEAIGSMGDDTPLAVLSDRPRLLYDYFRQLFAQVTNPPLDAIREELVTSLMTYLGAAPNLFEETPAHARRLRLEQPILTDADLARIRQAGDEALRTVTLAATFDGGRGGAGLQAALTRLCAEAADAVRAGATILILSDRTAGAVRLPIPALLATGAVHHHLIREGLRMRCSLVVESGEPREVHHFCTLLGYGAQAVNPYLALEVAHRLAADEGLDREEAEHNFIKAAGKGILKVMSKMGISTLQSYCGAQIFEAVGLGDEVIEAYFTGTPSRLGGVDLDVLAEEVRHRHAQAFPPVALPYGQELDAGGRYQWRRGGEHHQFFPLSIARLQHAVREGRFETYEEYARLVNEQTRRLGTLRGLLDFRTDDVTPVPLDEVEPWTEIVKRFKTGAMSYGSISRETHETLAEAMNRLGGKSNTGEGGEDPERYDRAHPARSRIKQVASGRFGVTIDYLTSADEIQIKMAQGAKPGEGGQLPGEKVYPWIARTRHSTPYVGLISPPPHHDIYSIEDLAQLIHDLKNSNPAARISVKLVSEVGVGTIAAGVAKGKADVVLISGHDGGTGASPQTSIMHAGLPWELGLSETHQTLVRNGLRRRIRVECDGQLKTGRDVAIACLLGADEFGFATAPLVALGCIMMRKCHLNTCPVGIATQDPALRKKFSGEPEHVINYFHFVAEELRQIMAALGFRTVDEMVGRVDRLRVREGIDHWKARYLDLSPILHRPRLPDLLARFQTDEQDHGLDRALDHRLIERARPALEQGERVTIETEIRNVHRTVGTLLSAEVSRRYGPAGLPDDTIVVRARGTAGQSFAAFGARGLTFDIEGEANDYFGKGLSGARLVLRPPREATYDPAHVIIVGNVALYGATSGEVFIRGQAGERFAVRNSGARAVVEGVGDHGCEYMTGGVVVVLGPTGRNFAAGMSGGVAYVLDGTHDFRRGRCNPEMVDLEPVTDPEDIAELRALIARHHALTGSTVAAWVLDDWETALREFVKVIPVEYRKALQRLAEEAADSSRVDASSETSMAA
ncbi:MAG: glutamate synthase [Rhodothermaceae bacterium]|nr:MAG: glutamate synthase [Rhodothermaceae bacterium]